jgi:hypothetical protein
MKRLTLSETPEARRPGSTALPFPSTDSRIANKSSFRVKSFPVRSEGNTYLVNRAFLL